MIQLRIVRRWNIWNITKSTCEKHVSIWRAQTVIDIYQLVQGHRSSQWVFIQRREKGRSLLAFCFYLGNKDREEGSQRMFLIVKIVLILQFDEGEGKLSNGLSIPETLLVKDGVGDPHDELILYRSVALRANLSYVRHLDQSEGRRGLRFSNTLITALGLKFVQLVFPSRRCSRQASCRRRKICWKVKKLLSVESIINIPSGSRSAAARQVHPVMKLGGWWASFWNKVKIKVSALNNTINIYWIII